MEVYSKSYIIATGNLKFNFIYDYTASGGGWADFDILNIGELSYGYDNENNIDLAIYPTNIDITIDDLEGNNYRCFKNFIEHYSLTYPYNFESVFILEIYHNERRIFKGILDELDSDKDTWELTLSFVDGINKLKDISIANPAVLDKLFSRGIISRVRKNGIAVYGFSHVRFYGTSFETADWVVKGMETGDKDSNFKSTVVELFKLLNDNANVEFNIEYLFKDNIGSPAGTIDNVKIRRILSHLLGRYIVIYKDEEIHNIGYLPGYPEYSKPEYFELIYEDSSYRVFYHNFNGVIDGSGYVFRPGVGAVSIGEMLKIIAKNLFSYFGFKDSGEVFLRHRRFTSNTTLLTNIISMNKALSVDKIQGVKIEDYYTNNYGTDGSDYGTEGLRTVNYKIPLNTFPTANSFESRMLYWDGSHERAVIYFTDRQIGFTDIPQEVISRAEWEAHKNFRDKYEFELEGIDYEFDQTYSVDYLNYKGKFRPVELSKNLLNNRSTMKAIQIN
jgi:hypothetical protein